jgi:hypothetical protein
MNPSHQMRHAPIVKSRSNIVLFPARHLPANLVLSSYVGVALNLALQSCAYRETVGALLYLVRPALLAGVYSFAPSMRNGLCPF